MKSKVAVLLLTLALAAWCAAQTGPQTEQITNGPTVEGVMANSATIAWSTNTGGSSVVRYGTDPNNLTQTAQSPWVSAGQTHRVQLTNLQPGKTYYYQVLSAQGQGTGTGALSNISQFNTPAGAAPSSAPTSGAHVPVYRAFNASAGTHLFTTDAAQFQNSRSLGFNPEGTVFYIDSTQGANEVPLYRFTGPNGQNAFSTNAAGLPGYTNAGVAGYVSSTQQPNTLPLHQLSNTRTGQFYYTADPSELSAFAADSRRQWRDQGVIGYVWQQ